MKSLVNIALLKEQLKRYWAIGVLAFIGYILSIVLPIYQMDDPENKLHILGMLLGMRHPIIIIASIMIPLFTVLATFSYLFQPKATTAMHAYPVNKNQLMATNIAAGFILMAIPLLLLCIFLLNPIEWVSNNPVTDSAGVVHYYPSAFLPMNFFTDGLVNGEVVNTFPIMAGFFFRTVCVFAFYYSVFLLAAMIVGNTVVYMFTSALLPFIHIGLYVLFPLAATLYSFGYESFTVNSVIMNLFIFTQPLSLVSMLTYDDPSTFVASEAAFEPMAPYIISYVIIGVALLCLSVFCNHIRRQERAGDSFVFTPVKNVLIFLLSMLSMVLMGALFAVRFNSIFAMYIGFAVGFSIAYFIAQMIAEKTLNVIFKAKELLRFGGVMVGIFIVVIVIMRFDLFGYSRFVPSADEVEGVYVNAPYGYFNGSVPERYKDSYFIKDKAIVSGVVAAHKEIISNKGQLRQTFTNNMVGNYYNPDIARQYIMYKLKSGKVVLRSYILPKTFMNDCGLSELLTEESVIMSEYYSFNNPSDIESVVINYRASVKTADTSDLLSDQELIDISNYSHGYVVDVSDPEEIAALLQEIKKDILITEDIMLSEELHTEFEYEFGTQQLQKYITGVSGSVTLKNSRQDVNYFNLLSAENTVSWLIENGYIKE